jgi:pimeloyl-ACP methyl ester carboxylesterase
MNYSFVLIHSPLVGPLSWEPVAEQLRVRDVETLVPSLRDTESRDVAYWQQHAQSAASAIEVIPADKALVLVGHSGAGPLLPPIGQQLRRPIAAYLFVDAGLPLDGKSRLDEMEENAPEFAAELRRHLAGGGRFPTWSDEDLREVIPDDRLRAGTLAEIQPRPLAFFEERIPGFGNGPDAPCGYLHFSGSYDAPAAQAQQAGWAHRHIDVGHFHMLVDPVGVADALLDLAGQLVAVDR